MKNVMNSKQKSIFIAAALRRKIRNCRLPSGTPLPSAHDLSVQYHVCMMTANRALDILEKESLIVRKKGIGNFVEKNVISGHRLMIGIADVTEYSQSYARNILIDIFPKTAISCCHAENCDCRIISYSDFEQKNTAAFEGLDGLLLGYVTFFL